jgi:hypothetical protein
MKNIGKHRERRPITTPVAPDAIVRGLSEARK